MEYSFWMDLLYYPSLFTTIILALVSYWGLAAFFSVKSTRGTSAASWLILAVWLGFLALALCTTYALYMGVAETAPINVVWNFIGAASIYLHFYARWKAIPEDEQPLWTPLLMGFYPDLHHWAVKSGMRLYGLLSLKKGK